MRGIHDRRTYVSLLATFLLLSLMLWRISVATHQDKLNRALDAAIADRNPAEVKSLLDQGASPRARVRPSPHLADYWQALWNPNAEDSRNRYRTVLMQAVRYRRADIVQILLSRGADVNAGDEYGRTALILAATGAFGNIARLLVDHGAQVNARTTDGWTPLLLNTTTDTAELLLDHGANINVQNKEGRTPVMLAAGGEHPDLVRLLIRRGADIHIKDYDGWTALMFARGQPAVIAMIKKAGARE